MIRQGHGNRVVPRYSASFRVLRILCSSRHFSKCELVIRAGRILSTVSECYPASYLLVPAEANEIQCSTEFNNVKSGNFPAKPGRSKFSIKSRGPDFAPLLFPPTHIVYRLWVNKLRLRPNFPSICFVLVSSSKVSTLNR